MKDEFEYQYALLKQALMCKLPDAAEEQKHIFAKMDKDVLTALAFSMQMDHKSPLMIDGIIHPFVEAVICLNYYAFDNLRDLWWSIITDGYNEYVCSVLVGLIRDDSLKVATLNCLKEEVEMLSNEDKEAFDITPTFIDFCNREIAYIQNHCLYSIEAIKARQDDRLKAVEDRVRRLELPPELQSEEAQALLQGAVEAGLCKPESQGRYKWLVVEAPLKSCAYFAAKMSKQLKLSKKPIAEGKGFRVKWQPFASIFGYATAQLKNAYASYNAIGMNDNEIESKIDAIFEA